MLNILVGALAFQAPMSQLASPRAGDIALSNTKWQAGLNGKSPLWGYTVGSRAPDAAVASGTTKKEQALWE